MFGFWLGPGHANLLNIIYVNVPEIGVSRPYIVLFAPNRPNSRFHLISRDDRHMGKVSLIGIDMKGAEVALLKGENGFGL